MIAVVFPIVVALALAPPPETPLTIEAARIEYLELEERVEASGNVRVTYGEDRLRADRITADLRTDEVLAEGDVSFTRGVEEVRTARLRYRWETRQAQAEDATTVYRGVIVRARELEYRPGRAEAIASRFTTCDLEPPHYHISARRIVIFPGQRIVAHGASIYLLGTRIFYLPRFSRSLRRDENGGIGLPTVTINSRDRILLRRSTTLVDRSDLLMDLDLGLSLRRGIVGGVEVVQPGRPARIAAIGIRQESPNQRRRFLEVDRLPEVGLAIGAPREARRPLRVPTTTQQIRIARDPEGGPRWEWGAEGTIGYFQQRGENDPEEELNRQGGRIDVRALVSRRRPKIGPFHLSSIRLLARTSVYTTGDRFNLIGLGVGDAWRLSPNLRVSLHRFLQATDGSTPFQFDAPDLLREWRPAAVLTLGNTEFVWEGRYDSDRNTFFDQEFAIARTFHCLRPRISYRTRRSQISFDLQVVGFQEPVEPPGRIDRAP